MKRAIAYLLPNEMALLLRFREARERAHKNLVYCRDTYDDGPGAVYWSAVVDAIAEQDAAENLGITRAEICGNCGARGGKHYPPCTGL